MGFSLSLYVDHSVNEHSLHEVEGIQDVLVMNHRTQLCVFDVSTLDLRRTQEGLKSLQNEFDAVGFSEAVQITLGHVLN